jgi:signal transduction histidine kinase
MIDQTAPHRHYTFRLVLYPDGSFDVTHGPLSSVPAAEIHVGDRSNWVTGAVPGGQRSAATQLDLATDLPYLGAGRDGLVSDPYMRLRSALHRRMLPLLRLIAASSGLALVGFPAFFYYSLIRPLGTLLAGIRQVNAGNLAVEMPVQYYDEVGLLTESFNRMVRELRGLVAGLEQRVSERTRELSVLYEVAAIASRSPELQTTLVHSLDQVLQAVGCDEGVIHILDEAGTMRLAVQQGLPDDIVAQVASLTVGGTEAWGKEYGETVFVPFVASGSGSVQPGRARRYVGIPMRTGGQIVGLLGVLREMARPGFSDQEITLLASVADQIGAAAQSARLRQRAERAAVMEERQRLARDLHDSVTQSLYSMTLLTEGGRRLANAGDLESIDDYFVDLGEIALQSLKEMRMLIYELRPPVLAQEGLVGALQRRLDTVEGRAGVEARLLMAGDFLENGDRMALPASMEQNLYSIAQEALNNALKHAAATSVTVWLRVDGEQLELEVVDDGHGFDPESAGGGLGLSTMRERAERLDGSLEIHSAPGEGTGIKAKIPYPPDAH